MSPTPSAVPSDMRPRSADAERRARSPQQDVVRPGRDGAHEPEPEQRDEPVHGRNGGRAVAGVLYDPAVTLGSRRAARHGPCLEAAGAWRPRGAPRPARRARLPGPHPRRLDAAARRPGRDPLRPRAPRTTAPSRRWCRSCLRTSSTTGVPPQPTATGSGSSTSSPTVIGESLIGTAVDRPALPDPGLREAPCRRSIARSAVSTTPRGGDRLHGVAERIRARDGRIPDGRRALGHARDRRWRSKRSVPTSTTISSSRSRSRPRPKPSASAPTHLARGFTTAFGIAPHAYVVTRRLEIARDRILAGPAVSRRRHRGRVLRSGALDPSIQAVPRRDAGTVHGRLIRPVNSRRAERRTSKGEPE